MTHTFKEIFVDLTGGDFPRNSYYSVKSNDFLSFWGTQLNWPRPRTCTSPLLTHSPKRTESDNYKKAGGKKCCSLTKSDLSSHALAVRSSFGNCPRPSSIFSELGNSFSSFSMGGLWACASCGKRGALTARDRGCCWTQARTPCGWPVPLKAPRGSLLRPEPRATRAPRGG